MSSLSSKSEREISQLLDEYGIKHGPIVGSTRALYEKKLKEAMAKEKGDSKVKSSPDKTYYREEGKRTKFEMSAFFAAEEVTYVTYRSPVQEDSADRTTYMRSRPAYSERDFVDEKPYSRSRVEYSGSDFSNEPLVYDTPSYRNVSYSKPTAVKPAGDPAKVESGSTRLIPLWVQILVFLLVAGFLYLVFMNMESDTSDPFKRLQ